MPAYDVNYVLATGVNVTTSANGPDVSLTGVLAGLKAGEIIEGILMVTGAIDNTTGNETEQVFIQEKVGSSYRDIAAFPVIGGALDGNVALATSGGMLKTYFKVSFNATHLRYRTLEGGTTPSLTGMQIILHPTNVAPVFM